MRRWPTSPEAWEPLAFLCPFCGGAVAWAMLGAEELLIHPLPACDEFTNNTVDGYLDRVVAALRPN